MNKQEAIKHVQPGDTLFFVLKNREIRPLIVTRTFPENGSVNGTLHFDGPNDQERLDAEIRSELLRTGTLWVEDIPYNEVPAGATGAALVPGTWHLPPKMAAAAGRT